MNDVLQKKINRLRWQCRRGMLELDLLLLPFFDQYYLSLSKACQTLFEELLNHQDPDLYQILIQRKPIANPALNSLVESICGH
jgi:antitoxin CptB